MLLTLLVDRVEQQVGVEEHQGVPGPSSVSIASATLEKSIHGRDMRLLQERSGSLLLGQAGTCKFIHRVAEADRALATTEATSSARVSVVRMSQACGHSRKFVDVSIG